MYAGIPGTFSMGIGVSTIWITEHSKGRSASNEADKPIEKYKSQRGAVIPFTSLLHYHGKASLVSWKELVAFPALICYQQADSRHLDAGQFIHLESSFLS